MEFSQISLNILFMTDEFKNTRYTLIHRLKDQYDENAWEEFIDIYRRYIYVVIRRMDIPVHEAEELTQNLLVKLWEKLPNFNFNPEVARFRTWLGKVIYNSVISYKRSKKNETFKLELDESHSVDSKISEMMNREWENYIANIALERVKPLFSGKAMEVFQMSLDGKDLKEIAESLEIKEDSVYRLKNRVKEKLSKEISFLREDLG